LLSSSRRPEILRFLPPVVIYGLILYGSSRSPELLARVGLEIPDFVGHFLEYLLLALALQPIFNKRRQFFTPGFWILLGILAALDESFQALVPGRTCSPVDWFTDVLGGGCGQALYLIFRRKYPG
jgi:VanZ family protein